MQKGYRNLRKGRASVNGQIHHVVFRVNPSQPKLESHECETLCRLTINPVITSHGDILCYVVMPDHVHILFQLNDNANLSQWVQRFKGMASRNLQRKPVKCKSIWQAGFYDRALRKEDDVVVVARYLVANPLRAGMVASVGQYPYWNAVWV